LFNYSQIDRFHQAKEKELYQERKQEMQIDRIEFYMDKKNFVSQPLSSMGKSGQILFNVEAKKLGCLPFSLYLR